MYAGYARWCRAGLERALWAQTASALPLSAASALATRHSPATSEVGPCGTVQAYVRTAWHARPPPGGPRSRSRGILLAPVRQMR